MFDDLDQLLKIRGKPQVPEYLSARIVAAAARRAQIGAYGEIYGLAAFWADLKAMVRLPDQAFAPAFAFGVLALFMLGAFAGSLSSGDLSVVASLTQEGLASFMMIEDGFIAGEWV